MTNRLVDRAIVPRGSMPRVPLGRSKVGTSAPIKVITPQMTLDLMDQVDASAKGLDHDIAAWSDKLVGPPPPLTDPEGLAKWAGKVDPFVVQWKEWFAKWRTFYESNVGGPLAWLDRGTVGTYQQVESYREQLLGWRDKAVSKGITVTAPAPPPPGGTDGFPWKTVILVAALGGGAYVAYRVYTAKQAAAPAAGG